MGKIQSIALVDRSKYKLYIGIDTGVETGFAVWDRQQKCLTAVSTIAIHFAMDLMVKLYAPMGKTVLVRVEDARLRKWIPRMPTASRERGRSEGAGSVKRDAKIWEDFLEDLGVDYELVAPKANKTKMKPDAFRKMTGYKPITSSHGRDAALLVYGY